MSIDAARRSVRDNLFAAIDRQDMPAFLACIAERASFRFGSTPAVVGHAAIGEAVNGFFATIGGLKHVLNKTVADETTLVCEGEVTYTRHDTTQITLPFVNVFEFDDGLISDYRIYIDIAPLYAQ